MLLGGKTDEEVVVVAVMLEVCVSARARWGCCVREDEGCCCCCEGCDWEVEDALRERVRVAVELNVLPGAAPTESGKVFPPAPAPRAGESEDQMSGLTFFKWDLDVSTEELYASGSMSCGWCEW